MKKFFISGIGTNVGKTIVSAILTEALKADYWKPIQSGSLEGLDSNTVKKLISNTQSIIHPEAYVFEEASSPHIASKKENIIIDETSIEIPITSNNLIIEGAGGLLVPINNSFYVCQLARKLNAEVVLVVSSYLGCINHTFLSMHYIESMNLPFAGIILNGNFEKEVRNTIVNTGVTVLAEINELEVLNKKIIIREAKKIKLKNFNGLV